jgi:ribosome biogenesis GTPase
MTSHTLRLETLGWTEARAREFAPYADAGLVAGRVSLEHNHVFRVLSAHGERLAEAAGRLKHRAETRSGLPVVGDWVALREDASGARSQIVHVLSRKSALSRKAAGRETEEQLVAANIDTLFVVFGLDKAVNHEAIERYLVVVRASGAAPVVVLNKRDLIADPQQAIAVARDVSGDAPVMAVSARTREGLDQLLRWLSDARTIAVIGPSGAGKSSLVNALVAEERLPTGEVRPWDSRGRHTSVHRELVIRAEGGLIIDTPGMRELQLWDTGAVADAFLDIAELADSCRFRDCRHDREPGCAVKAAVDEGAIDARRYASFLKLQAEQQETERKRIDRELTTAKRDAKVQTRALRAHQKTHQKHKDRQG